MINTVIIIVVVQNYISNQLNGSKNHLSILSLKKIVTKMLMRSKTEQYYHCVKHNMLTYMQLYIQ